MSRAFVKESDSDGPDELPDLPVSPHPNFVTPHGLAQLRARLTDAEAQLQAVDPGALTAVLERAQLARDMRWLQARIASAIPVEPARQPQDRVDFGATVELEDGQGRRYRYCIVGEDEADPERGSISWVSPLALALKGARVGDAVTWPRPAGDLVVEVLGIGYGS